MLYNDMNGCIKLIRKVMTLSDNERNLISKCNRELYAGMVKMGTLAD